MVSSWTDFSISRALVVIEIINLEQLKEQQQKICMLRFKEGYLNSWKPILNFWKIKFIWYFKLYLQLIAIVTALIQPMVPTLLINSELEQFCLLNLFWIKGEFENKKKILLIKFTDWLDCRWLEQTNQKTYRERQLSVPGIIYYFQVHVVPANFREFYFNFKINFSWRKQLGYVIPGTLTFPQ